MHGIELLLANCDRLTRLTDMTYFEGVTPEEIEKLKARIKETNLNIVFDDVEEKNSRNIFIDENFMHDKMKEKYPPCAGWNDTGWFHLHLFVFPLIYQFNSRIGVLVHSSFAND